MASGDHCLIRKTSYGAFYVIHYDCDDYLDGTVTNPMTGEIIRTASES